MRRLLSWEDNTGCLRNDLGLVSAVVEMVLGEKWIEERCNVCGILNIHYGICPFEKDMVY